MGLHTTAAMLESLGLPTDNLDPVFEVEETQHIDGTLSPFRRAPPVPLGSSRSTPIGPPSSQRSRCPAFRWEPLLTRS